MNRIFVILCFLFLVACSSKEKVDSQSVRKEMKNREVFRYSDSEITDQALKLVEGVFDLTTEVDFRVQPVKTDQSPKTELLFEAFQYAFDNKLESRPQCDNVGDSVVCYVLGKDSTDFQVLKVSFLKRDVVLSLSSD